MELGGIGVAKRCLDPRLVYIPARNLKFRMLVIADHRDARRMTNQKALLLSFTAVAASTYTCSPIWRNFSDICAMPAFANASAGKPSASAPDTVIPTEF